MRFMDGTLCLIKWELLFKDDTLTQLKLNPTEILKGADDKTDRIISSDRYFCKHPMPKYLLSPQKTDEQNP